MKRVLHIIAELGIGGAEKVALDLGLYMKEHGYESHYIVFGDAVGDYETILTAQGQCIFYLQSPGKNYLRFYNELMALIKKNRYNVVHAHKMFNCGIAMLAAHRAGVPVRISHAHSALYDQSRLSRKIYEAAMQKLIWRHSTNCVACGTAAGARLFGEKAFEKGCQLILNGVDTERFRFSEESRCRIRTELGLEKSFVIGHAGRLVEVKNQQFLIRLLPEILKKRPESKLLLLGDGEDKQQLDRLVRELKLESEVIRPGNVLNVYDYLSAMDVFAFPSLYEGMPLSIIEVQSNGLPCVLSTGIPKDVYLTDLVHPLPLDKPFAWVETICSAQRSEPEKYADELKVKGFDIEAVMQKFMEIYERA